MAEKQYLVTRCDEDSLQHSRSHKYIDRYYKNGRYNYVYDEKTGQARSTIQGTSGGQHKKEGVEGRSGEAEKGKNYDLALKSWREFNNATMNGDEFMTDWFGHSRGYHMFIQLQKRYGDDTVVTHGRDLIKAMTETFLHYNEYEGGSRDAYLKKMDDKMVQEATKLRDRLKNRTVAVGKYNHYNWDTDHTRLSGRSQYQN